MCPDMIDESEDPKICKTKNNIIIVFLITGGKNQQQQQQIYGN
jgi:hypothetical protein